MNTRNSMKLSFFFLLIVLLVGAYLIANSLPPASNPDSQWVGISLHSLSVNEAQIVDASGACWIRIDVFPEFETAIKNAKEHDLKVLAILDSWMFNEKVNFTLEEWRGNVTYYVSQYADYVDAWEIWNEPANPEINNTLLNLTIFDYNENKIIYENMSRIVEFYFSMVEVASPIIREYDPSAKIILFGGLNLWSGIDPHLELDMEFAKELSALNIEQYGDAISVHAYPWMEIVDADVWGKYNQSLADYRDFFNIEIWVTETGHYVDIEGEEGQAQYIVDAFDYFEGKVDKFFWYSLLDNAWEDRDFGLIDEGKPRLAYYELQNKLK